jgi:hypothetical protein
MSGPKIKAKICMQAEYFLIFALKPKGRSNHPPRRLVTQNKAYAFQTTIEI